MQVVFDKEMGEQIIVRKQKRAYKIYTGVTTKGVTTALRKAIIGIDMTNFNSIVDAILNVKPVDVMITKSDGEEVAYQAAMAERNEGKPYGTYQGD